MVGFPLAQVDQQVANRTGVGTAVGGLQGLPQGQGQGGGAVAAGPGHQELKLLLLLLIEAAEIERLPLAQHVMPALFSLDLQHLVATFPS